MKMQCFLQSIATQGHGGGKSNHSSSDRSRKVAISRHLHAPRHAEWSLKFHVVGVHNPTIGHSRVAKQRRETTLGAG